MIVLAVYALLVAVSLINLFAMRRPRPGREGDGAGSLVVLVPARNEAANLAELLPQLAGTVVYVYDDGSTDGTAEVAEAHGARVIRGSEELPEGWTGKNRACDALARHALAEETPDWILFLDADVRLKAGALAGLARFLEREGARVSIVTGFPAFRPGRGAEPLALFWVPWILLATNPFGLVARTGRGHNGFTNGQVTAWRAARYRQLEPHRALRGAILEDVRIGRWLARRGERVEVARLDRLFEVRMYETAAAAVEGMSKNAYEITGSAAGTVALATLLLGSSGAWAALGEAWWAGYGLLAASGAIVTAAVRYAPWVWPLTPIALVVGAFTLLRSLVLRRRGRVVWKGRTYGRPG